MKIKFIGISDSDFTNGKVYQLLNMDFERFGVDTYISNNSKKIKCIVYASITAFNENWEVVD